MDSGEAWKALWRVPGVGALTLSLYNGKAGFPADAREAEMETADLPVSLAVASSQAGFKAKLVDLRSRGYQD